MDLVTAWRWWSWAAGKKDVLPSAGKHNTYVWGVEMRGGGH